MAEDNSTIIVIGIAALAFMAFLYWKSSQQPVVALQQKTTITEFIRDEKGHITQIMERG